MTSSFCTEFPLRRRGSAGAVVFRVVAVVPAVVVAVVVVSAMLTQSAHADDGLFPSGTFPPLPSSGIERLLPDDERDPRPISPLSSTGARAQELTSSPLHGRVFWVASVVNPDAEKTVFITPQYHRSPGSPLLFTSVGAAVRDVQDHIAAITLHLARRHGLQCAGTEGDFDAHIARSHDIERVAWSLRDLRVAAAGARLVLVDDDEGEDAVETILVVMETATRDHARTLDGVGMAQERIRDVRPFHRFGIENRRLLNEALAIAAEREAISQKLALYFPDDAASGEDPLMDLVLSEYPLYRASTLDPLSTSLALLEAKRTALVQAGDGELATLLSRFLARTRVLADVTIRPDDVDALHAHYARVRDGASASLDAGPATSTTTRPHTKAALAVITSLRKKKAALDKEHRAFTLDAREKNAALRIKDALAASSSSSAPAPDVCLVVMGAHHEAGLVRAVKTAMPDVGVIVLRPFPDEDAPTPD